MAGFSIANQLAAAHARVIAVDTTMNIAGREVH